MLTRITRFQQLDYPEADHRDQPSFASNNESLSYSPFLSPLILLPCLPYPLSKRHVSVEMKYMKCACKDCGLFVVPLSFLVTTISKPGARW